MHVRVTTFHVSPENLAHARARSKNAQTQVAAIPGLREWFVAGRDDGQCTAVALYASEEAANAAFPHVKALLSQYADLIVSAPLHLAYEVYMHHQLSSGQ